MPHIPSSIWYCVHDLHVQKININSLDANEFEKKLEEEQLKDGRKLGVCIPKAKGRIV